MLRKIFFSVAVLAIGMGNVHSEVITFKIFSGRQIPIEVDTIANLNDLKQALADKLNTDVDHVTTDRVRVEFKKKDINDGNFEELKAGLPHTASTNVYVSSAPAPAHSTRITFMVISTRQIPIEMNTIANLDGLKKALANKLNKDVDHVTTDRVKVALEYNLEHKKILKDITDDNFKALKGKFSLADKCSVNVSPAPAPAPAPAAPVVVSVPVPTGQRRNPRSIVPTTPPARSRSLVDRRAVAGLAAVGSAFVIAKLFSGSQATARIKTAQGMVVKVSFDAKKDSFMTFKQKVAAQLKIRTDSFGLMIAGNELTTKNFNNYRSAVTKQESVLELTTEEADKTSL